MRRAARTHAAGVERHEGPAVVLVAALEHDDLAAHERRQILRPVDERLGATRPAGRPMRIAATRVRSRRWTTALVKWVVPIITASTGRRRSGLPAARAAPRSIPEVTSRVVGVLTA